MTEALEALRNAHFNWARSLESIWIDADASIDGPNKDIAAQIVQRLHAEAHPGSLESPKGEILLGQAGIGKTHFMGVLRREVWASRGWFVLLDVISLSDFWRSAALSFVTSLLQEMPRSRRRQYEAVIAGVARRLKMEALIEAAFKTSSYDPRKLVGQILTSLNKIDPTNTLEYSDVLRALCLLRSEDFAVSGLAHSWLQGYDADDQARVALGFQRPPPTPKELVRGMCWIMSLAGPILIGVDQIDGVVNPSIARSADDDDIDAAPALAETLAAGLLDLITTVGTRGKVAVACLDDSWEVMKERGLLSAIQRFDEPVRLIGMNEPESVRALIANRLTPAFALAKATPPYPTYPFADAAIASAASVSLTPRVILMRCDAHRRNCLAKGAVDECDSLISTPANGTTKQPGGEALQGAYGELHAACDIGGLIDDQNDQAFGALLRETFGLYARQVMLPDSIDIESRADPAQKVPPLHGRLTFTLHDENDREVHFCFRALEHKNAVAFQARLRAALTASGISSKITDWHMLLVRKSPIPSGPKTKTLFDGFTKRGGVVINPTDDDLRTFVALRDLRDACESDGRIDAFERWLRDEKPLDQTAFFQSAGLVPPPIPGLPPSHKPTTDAAAGSPPVKDRAGSNAATPEPTPEAKSGGAARDAVSPPTVSPQVLSAAPPARDSTPDESIPVGYRVIGNELVFLPTRLLPRHTAILAGSGSGKTVLLRRIVEEAALAGIPAIVIDPNNDLSRLGEPWPARPADFTPDDDAKAKRLSETVEVVVWTPGVRAGNPVFLPVMPDFASVSDDQDDRLQAVEMAAETLGPLAGAKSQLQRGVLADALKLFAGRGGGDLGQFTSLLADLPEGVSRIRGAEKLAEKMANELHAAVATNPLLRAEGPVLDPAVLFFGPDPGRVRISVINLSGLGSDFAREDFVNRLQMALFGWIKKHPSPRGLLYVLDEAQTFLPSQKPALTLGSGIKLVAQARKYGLGLVVATQAPRGIHNQVVSNCTTQFFGKQNAPATIAAAQEIIGASGGRAEDIGKLARGEFYFATEGLGRPAKLRTPLCLSYHPANPPAPSEVIALAKASAR